MSGSKAAAFQNYIEERYEGKVYKMERIHRPDYVGLEVHVMFRMPDDGVVDELEMFKRINKVINVIAEG